MWRALRISVLLIALIVVAGVTWGDRFRTTRWTETLWVGVFPVNGDGSRTVDEYIAGLDSADFRDIEVFFAQEGAVHGLRLEQPVRMDLHPAVSRPPPQLDAGAGFLARASWILRLRYYGWRMAGDTFADVRVFLVYHDAERTQVAPDSRGLQRGLMAVAHVFATESMAAQNNIVVAHEVLHTLGASDKYDPASNLPL
ncbi:MAG: hypothetical protein L6Q83_05640, partial [Gammaproteobacteria bacterium]|nr:hypothetical protein [Gammaproteobacteria bacterium]